MASDESAKYVYCIIKTSGKLAFDDATAIGAPESPVYTIPHNGLAAIVSDSATEKYESTSANWVTHEKVVEHVMQEFTLLPVRFGTVSRMESPVEDIVRLLDRRGAELRRLLDELEGKVELGLKVSWENEKTAVDQVLADNAGLRKMRDAILSPSSKVASQEKANLARLVKEAVDQRRLTEAAKLVAPLRVLAAKTVEHKTTEDRMVLNAAFLVEKRRERAFDTAVDILEESAGDGMVFKYFGPVPPYGFVNLTLNWGVG